MKEVNIGKGERRFKTYTYTDKKRNKTILKICDTTKYRGREYKIVELTNKKTSRYTTQCAYLKPLDSKENRIGIIRKGKIDKLDEICPWGSNTWVKRSWVYNIKK